MPLNVQEQFGQIDIYVFDQILRGNITQETRVLDAGCGYGRNLVHLLRQGCEVFALDADRDAVEHVRQLSASLKTGLPAENFQVGFIERMPFPDAFADVVLCNSILRFTYVIGDGSEWFLVDDAFRSEREDECRSRRSPEDYDRSRLSLHDNMGTTKANANSELDGRNYRDRSGGISPLSRSLQRHHSGRISCPRTTSDGVPGSGDQSLRAGTANRFSIGCCRWWSARSKRPQWMGMGKPWPLKARKLRNG